MSCNFGDNIKIQIFGQSHSENIGVVIDGLPPNFQIDMEKINAFLKRRQGGKSYSTQRKESDTPKVISGLIDNKTCGSPLTALFENNNTKSKDYSKLSDVPRPSHADYVASIKYEGANDIRGGGHFSGRMTLPLCFAGAVCMQLLEEKGVKIGGHILSIGSIEDEKLSPLEVNFEGIDKDFPVINLQNKELMIEEILKCAKEKDSIGGSVECAITGLPIGIGTPMFNGLENKISSAIFGIPAIKGIEFGAGFEACQMRGSAHNDCYRYEEGQVKIKSNNAGGILGGISTGMPVIFRVAVKPTPSIFQEQDSINLKEKRNETLIIEGRHDPCIVPRVVPCVEAAAAIAIADLICFE